MPTLVIKVQFPTDRTQTGSATLFDASGKAIAGPFKALGKADNATATQNGNPNRNPLLPYGDTPTGAYKVPQIIKTGAGTNYPPRSYGSAGAIVLDPESGDALTAKVNGREGLLIHSGDLGAGGRLRATHGCIRLSEADMKGLFAAARAATDAGSTLRCEAMDFSVIVGDPSDDTSDPGTVDPPDGIGGLLNPGPPILPLMTPARQLAVTSAAAKVSTPVSTGNLAIAAVLFGIAVWAATKLENGAVTLPDMTSGTIPAATQSVLQSMLLLSVLIERSTQVLLSALGLDAERQFNPEDGTVSKSVDADPTATLLAVILSVLLAVIGIRILPTLLTPNLCSATTVTGCLGDWGKVLYTIVDVTISAGLIAGGAKVIHPLIGSVTGGFERIQKLARGETRRAWLRDQGN